MIYFISDLDGTLIFPFENGLIPVEFNPLGQTTHAMPPEAKRILDTLLLHPDFCFVPCSARGIDHLRSVSFIHLDTLPFAVANYGLNIYRFGKLDEQWLSSGLREFAKPELSDVQSFLASKGYPCLKNYYGCYLLCKKSSSSDTLALHSIPSIFPDYQIIDHKTKIIALPKTLDKSRAVRKILGEIPGNSFSIGAGDDPQDTRFLALCNEAFYPPESRLFMPPTSLSHPVPSCKPYSSVDILKQIQIRLSSSSD